MFEYILSRKKPRLGLSQEGEVEKVAGRAQEGVNAPEGAEVVTGAFRS